MPLDPSTEAQSIFTDLIADAVFPSAAVDVTGADYTLPVQLGNPLYVAPSAITLEDLTTKLPDGTGAFDVLMTSMKAHITEEYDSGRITGNEYATAYIQLTTAALTTAAQFLLQRDAATYQNALIQMQARTAEIQAVIAAATLAQEKQTLILRQAQVLTAQTEYALGKMRLATEDITYTRVEKEIEVASAQKLQIDAETATITYRLTYILPEEKREMAYNIDYVLTAAVAKTNYEIANILPQQKSGLEKDVAIKTYQLASIMPEQLKLVKEQGEVQRAQTLNTRSDNITAVAGAIGKQKDLYDEQISSYVKDARIKGAKFWMDGWITQKSLDEGLLAPAQLANAKVDEVLASLKIDLGLS